MGKSEFHLWIDLLNKVIDNILKSIRNPLLINKIKAQTLTLTVNSICAFWSHNIIWWIVNLRYGKVLDLYDLDLV